MERIGQENGRRTVQDGIADAIAALFGAIESGEGEGAIARSAVVALQRFGFTGASVQLLRDTNGSATLETVAAAGGRSAFMLGTSQTLEEASESGRVLFSGVARYVAEPGATDTEPAEGLQRWRTESEAKGYAVLPLRVGEQRLGVLTFEWPDEAPGPRDRAALDIFASVLALSLHATVDASRTTTEAAATPAPQAPTPAPRPTAKSLDVTDEGALFPPSAGAGMGLAPLAHVHLSCTAPESRHAAFVEATPGKNGSVVLAAGALHATEDADEMIDSAAAVARAAAPKATDASRALALLEGWLSGQGRSGLALSGAVALFVPEKNAFAVSTAGACALLLHDHTGRFGMVPPESPPFGGAGAPRLESHMRVLLPGDRVALLIGHVAELGHGEKAAAARDLMQGLSDRNATDVVSELLRTVAPSGEPGAIILLEVAG